MKKKLSVYLCMALCCSKIVSCKLRISWLCSSIILNCSSLTSSKNCCDRFKVCSLCSNRTFSVTISFSIRWNHNFASYVYWKLIFSKVNVPFWYSKCLSQGTSLFSRQIVKIVPLTNKMALRQLVTVNCCHINVKDNSVPDVWERANHKLLEPQN